MIRVTLTPEDLGVADDVFKRRAGQHGDRTLNHLTGVKSEIALCKYLGGPAYGTWLAAHAFAVDFKAIPCDVPPHFQVRATTFPNGCMIFTRGKDREDQIYVLAVVNHSEVDIVGWRAGADIAADENAASLRDVKSTAREVRGGRPLDCTHMVPQSDLHPMEELPR